MVHGSRYPLHFLHSELTSSPWSHQESPPGGPTCGSRFGTWQIAGDSRAVGRRAATGDPAGPETSASAALSRRGPFLPRSSPSGPKRKSHLLEQNFRFFVVPRGGVDTDIHPPHHIDLVVFHLGKDELLLDPERIIPATIEGMRRDPSTALSMILTFATASPSPMLITTFSSRGT